MPDVITQVLVDDEREIRANVPLSDQPETLEYTFRTNFHNDRELDPAVRSIKPKDIVVVVLATGSETGPFPVEVTLTRPNENEPFKKEEQNNLPDPSFTIPPGAVPGILFALNTGSAPSSPGGAAVGPDEPPAEPTIRDKTTHTITQDDPNGEWRITIRNVGNRDGIFRILIAHPGIQTRLETAKIPLSLLNRMVKKIVKLMDPQVRIHTAVRIDFSEEFKRLTDLEPQFFGSDLPSRDINLKPPEVAVEERGDNVVFRARFGFETGGDSEIDVNNFPNPDIRKLEFAFGVMFANTGSSVTSPNPNLVFLQHRKLVGDDIGGIGGRVSMNVTFNFGIDVRIAGVDVSDLEVEGILFSIPSLTSRIRSGIEVELVKPATKEKLGVLAEHFTDALMFLSTGNPNRVFFDIGSDGESAVIRHYRKPSPRAFRAGSPRVTGREWRGRSRRDGAHWLRRRGDCRGRGVDFGCGVRDAPRSSGQRSRRVHHGSRQRGHQLQTDRAHRRADDGEPLLRSPPWIPVVHQRAQRCRWSSQSGPRLESGSR